MFETLQVHNDGHDLKRLADQQAPQVARECGDDEGEDFPPLPALVIYQGKVICPDRL